MAGKTLFLTETLYDYMKKTTVREPDVLAELRRETARLPMHMMQISPEQGQFMSFLVKLMGVRRAIEIGVFTGYSALCVALAMPAEGRLIACETNAQWTDIARNYWNKAGVQSKIDLRLGTAVQTLDSLIKSNGYKGSFDFAFIDGDKESYDGYYERCLQLLRPNGLMLIDNVFWHGSVADETAVDRETDHLRRLNLKIREDRRVDISTIPIGDGLTLVRKKNEAA